MEHLCRARELARKRAVITQSETRCTFMNFKFISYVRTNVRDLCNYKQETISSSFGILRGYLELA